MDEVRDWLASVRTHRGIDAALLEEVWDPLVEPLRGHPTARVFLASSRPATRPAAEPVAQKGSTSSAVP